MVVVSWGGVLRRVDERLGTGVGVNGVHCKDVGHSQEDMEVKKGGDMDIPHRQRVS
jgi:hypothetical protein